MLSFQLRSAQVELQAHRVWLNTFVGRSRYGDATTHSTLRRNFTSAHRYGHGQVQGQGQVQSREQEPELEQGQEQEQRLGKKQSQQHTHKEEHKGKEFFILARARANADADHRRRAQKESNAAADSSSNNINLSDAQRRKRERWERRRSSPQTVQLKALGVRQDLLNAVNRDDADAVFRLYDELPEKKPLAGDDFLAIVECTQRALRIETQNSQQLQTADAKQRIISFAELLARDIRRGNIVPSRSAHTRLLSIFRDTGHLDAGVKFWRWLETQDDQHVHVNTYSVAIELLAVQGAPLEELEALYTNASARFPGNFSAYHLSPNAIVPDRDASCDIKGLPIGLLQAIVTAYLLRGNSHQAYLALDTMFRLYPTALDYRFIRLYLEERPLSEAYTVFAMACRAGMAIPTIVIRTLISRFRTTAEVDSSPQHRFATLRAMLAMMHLYLGATGKVLSNNISELVIATTRIFRLPGVDKLDGKQRKQLIDAILLFVRRMLETVAQFGTLPSMTAFNSILINVAGYGRSKETLDIVLKDLEALKQTPTDVTRRTILAIAGMWEDQSMIEESWNRILVARRQNEQWPDSIDFFVLSKAVKTTGQVAFAEQQFDTLKMYIPEHQHSAIEYAISKPDEPADSATTAKEAVSFEELYDGVQKLNADLTVLAKESRNCPSVQDYSGKKLPITLLQPKGVLRATEEVMRQVYDEMTTEPSSATSHPATGSDISALTTGLSLPPIRSPTNLTLGELRYESWKSINYLLQLAEKHDSLRDEIVDRSIADGKLPPPKNMSFTQKELNSMSDFGLSTTEVWHSRERDSKISIEEYRAEVMRLRGVKQVSGSTTEGK